MKIITKYWVLAIGIFLICLASTTTTAGTLSALDIQQYVMATKSNRVTADALIELEVSLPDFPKIDPILFEDEADVPYTISSKAISIKGSDIPALVSELKDIPKSLKPLTVVVRVKNRLVKATMGRRGDIKIDPVDLEVTVYKKRRYQITPSTKPKIKALIKKIKIEVEEYNNRGKFIEMSFDTTLPKIDDEVFNSILAGKKVHGEYYVEY